ncbi:hypothetical protein JM658_16105 [Joostella atrarenae]|uniref:Uncharacterized protein n=1 Tax=Joostella atrarenae TaxID=679257 RepID=A0ABS9J7G6_9FLAO|nr:hypothetical protein [Joostella atrarenae]MCF8716354.1 hypothetical protein [Joostella atrarenae]
MGNETIQTYYRTIGLLNHLNIPINDDLMINIGSSKGTYNYIKSKFQLDNEILEMLIEIYKIERKKNKLNNTNDEIKKIFKQEHKNCINRDIILKKQSVDLQHITFQKNPFVNIFKSQWDWNIDNYEDSSIFYNKILNENRGKYYFLFQQTGSKELLKQSNILELSLNEYQFFLICIFNRPFKISSAIEIFSKEFNCKFATEKIKFNNIVEVLIKELIFKQIIVQVKY